MELKKNKYYISFIFLCLAISEKKIALRIRSFLSDCTKLTMHIFYKIKKLRCNTLNKYCHLFTCILLRKFYLLTLVFFSALNLNTKAQNFDLAWAKGIGGSGTDQTTAITLDAAGNLYTTGTFSGTVDFNPGAGTYNLTSAGSGDIFICKLDALGNFIWANQMGGSSFDVAKAIALDLSGNIYTTGRFQSTADFDPGAGSYNLTSFGLIDIFVSKLDPNGNFLWAKQMGGNGNDGANAIGIDANGNVFTTGSFSTTADFDPGPATYNFICVGNVDLFVSKLDPNGNFLWATQAGGTAGEEGNALFVDATGNVFTTGLIGSPTVDFDPGPGVFNLFGDGAFILKLDATGNFVWAKEFKVAVFGGVWTYAIKPDATGNIYTTGWFNTTIDFDPGPGIFNLVPPLTNAIDIHITKLDPNGNFVWAKQMSGNTLGFVNSGSSLDIDGNGRIYTTGRFTGSFDFDPGSGTYNLTTFGSADVYISTLDAAGNFLGAKQMGGIGNDLGNSIKIDGFNNIYVAGQFSNTCDFDPCSGNYNLTSAGGDDIFITKFASPSVSITASSIAICSGTSVTFTATPTNGGPTPSYQWQVNGVNVGASSPTYTTTTLNNNDQISFILTSNATCVPPTIAASNVITITVGAAVSASVSISTPATTVCQGTSVTFTATPTNGGSTPAYQWQVNGANVGANSPTYTISTLSNGDVVKVIMTSSAACATPPSSTSNAITMTVSPGGPAQVSISSTGSTICVGGSVTFTATLTNGGPTASYLWQVNGSNVGTNSTSYTTNTLANGDVVRVIMTSSLSCATGSPVTSNSITMTVLPPGPASVNISTPSATICSGTSITFSAVPINGGSSPTYQWQINGGNVGSNSSTFTTSSLANGDVVQVIMTSNLSCATGSPATSNSITIIVTQSLTPSVSIGASSSTICAGTNVTFTANPTNGGTTPSYQWQINGVNVGANNPVYANNTLNNGDVVKCILTSNYVCVTATTATSNTIQMTVNTAVIPSVSIVTSANNICIGTLVTFTATPVNGGSAPSYQWKSNGINVGANSPTYSTNTISNGDVISCVLTNLNSCSPVTTANSNNIAMIVTTTVVPSLTISSTANNICPDATVTFTAVPVNVGTTPSYQWQLNGTNVGGNNLTYINNSFTNGDKINCIMNTVTSCAITPFVYSDTITMIVKPMPIISFNPTNATISLGSSVQLNATVTGNLTSYLWTPSTGLNNPTILNPIANPVTTTIYNLNVIATNSCSADKKLTVTVFKDIYIPNSFTPNGDTKNDVFRIPPGTSLSLQYFIIYDRYGNGVFKTSDINTGWNGTYKGAKSPNGAYTYLIKGSDSKGEIFLNGTVLVIR